MRSLKNFKILPVPCTYILEMASPLVAPASTLVSLLLQLKKATVFNFHQALFAPAMSKDVSQVGVALFPSF